MIDMLKMSKRKIIEKIVQSKRQYEQDFWIKVYEDSDDWMKSK